MWQKHWEAVQIAENNKAKISGDTELAKMLKELSSMVPKLARARFSGVGLEEVATEYSQLEEAIEARLSAFGLCRAELEEVPFCKMCGDTGKSAGGDCECLKKYEAEYFAGQVFGGTEKVDFEKAYAVANEYGGLSKYYEYARGYVERYPNVKNKLLFFQGEVGTGKTYLAKAMLCELEKKGVGVLAISAFALSNLFSDHQTQMRAFQKNVDTIDGYGAILNVEVLLCDDLGAEVFHGDKTEEYFVQMLDERMSQGKLTIFTSNLTSQQCKERYGLRFFSRLTAENANVFNLKTVGEGGEVVDLRRKERE